VPGVSVSRLAMRASCDESCGFSRRPLAFALATHHD
jgi:hypothetical protein